MEDKLIFKCLCGQETHIVRGEGGVRYNKEKHGSDAPADGCFNCHKPLKEDNSSQRTEDGTKPEIDDGDNNAQTGKNDDGAAEKTDDGLSDVSAKAGQQTTDDGATGSLFSMSRKQLVKKAKEYGLKIPPAISDKAIIEMIVNAQNSPAGDNEE